jgi:hypothetical protein
MGNFPYSLFTMNFETIARYLVLNLIDDGRDLVYSTVCPHLPDGRRSHERFNPARSKCPGLSHPFTKKKVSRRIKAEYLENFYHTHKVYFNLSDDIVRTNALIAWLDSTSPDLLAPIRYFSIHARACPCSINSGSRGSNNVEVRRKNERYTVVSSRCFNSLGDDVSKDLKDRVREICEGLPEENGRSTMTKEALEKLFQVVSRGFEGHCDPYCGNRANGRTTMYPDIWLRRWVSNFDPRQEARKLTAYRRWR